MKLIDKDRVVEEIKRKIEAHKETLKNCDSSISEMVLKGSISAYQNLLHFLDTLEVEDVDLEEKATQLSQKYFPDEENIWARSNIEAHKCKSACIEMVEWLKAQKGE